MLRRSIVPLEIAMSETVLDIRQTYFAAPRPEAMIGLISPLWAYFTGAALMGMTWWWMTRWMRPLKIVPPATTAELPPPPMIAALAAGDLPLAPIGGEAAPVSPAIAAIEPPARAALEAMAPAAAPAEPPSLASVVADAEPPPSVSIAAAASQPPAPEAAPEPPARTGRKGKGEAEPKPH